MKRSRKNFVAGAIMALALAAVMMLCLPLASVANTYPPTTTRNFYGDADGNTAITGTDLVQHSNYILSKAFTYDTLQPANSNQSWNTCDVNSDRGCTGLDTVQMNNYILSKAVSIGARPWGLTNVNLPLIGNAAGTWIPFNINQFSTHAILGLSGRPGISVVVEIDPTSPGTGELSGRTCTPVAGPSTRDQATALGAQCALATTISDWPTSLTQGLTESGTYGLQVKGNGDGDLKLNVYTSAVVGLDIPATTLSLTVGFGPLPPSADIDCSNPGPNPVYQGQLIRCTVTGDSGPPIVDVGTDTCGGTITAGIYSFIPGGGGDRTCVAGVINGPVSDTDTVTILDANLQPTITVTCGSADENAAGTCDITVGDGDIPPDTLTCTVEVSTTCTGVTLTGCTTANVPAQGEGGERSCTVAVVVNDNSGTLSATNAAGDSFTINDVNMQPTVSVSCGSAPENGAGNCSVLVGDIDIPADALTCSLDAATTCIGVNLTGCSSVSVPAQGEGGARSCVVAVTVDDNTSFLNATATDSDNFSITDVNIQPTIALTCPGSVDESGAINCTIAVGDGDTPADSLSCSLGVGDTCGGVLTGCASYDQANLIGKAPGCVVDVVVNDNAGQPNSTASDTKSVTIVDVNLQPTITVTCGSADENAAGTCDITVGDADIPADTLTCTVETSTTCAGVTLTGCVTANVPAQGEGGERSCTVAVVVNDNSGQLNGTAVHFDSFTINDVNMQPTVSVSCGSAPENGAGSCSVLVGDIDIPADALTCSLDAATTCIGVNLTGCSSVSVPAQGEGGARSCVVAVTVDDNTSFLNATATGSDNFSITDVNIQPTIALTCPGSVVESGAINCAIAVGDGDVPADSLSCSLGAGDTCGGALTGCASYSQTSLIGKAPGCVVDVVVNDNAGQPNSTDSDSKSVTIIDVNIQPTISVNCGSANEDAAGTCDITVGDADIPADTLTCTVEVSTTCTGVTLTGCTTANVPAQGEGGARSCTVAVVVNDNSGQLNGTAVHFDSFSITDVNVQPTIALGCPGSIVEPGPINCTIAVGDADVPADTLSCSIGAGDTCGGLLTGCTNYDLANSAGKSPNCDVQVVVNDNAGQPNSTASDSNTVAVGVESVALSCPAGVNEDATSSCTITAIGGSPCTIGAGTTCTGVTITNCTQIDIAAQGEAAGPGSCDVQVLKGLAGDAKTIVINEANESPTISVSCGSAAEDAAGSCGITVGDGDIPANTLTCSLDAATTCTGVTLTGCTSADVPAQGEGGARLCVVAVTVDDNSGAGNATATDSDNFSITDVNIQPTIALTCPGSVTEPAAINCTIAVGDGDIPADALTCSLGAGDTCGGSLTGCTNYDLADSTGKNPGCDVQVVVDDNAGQPNSTASDTNAVTVVAESVALTCPASVNEDATSSCTITAVGGSPCTIGAGTTCTGVTISDCTQIDIAAQGEAAGPGSCDVEVVKGLANDAETINILEVNVNPEFTSTAPTTATEDVLYTYDMTASDPEFDPITFQVAAGDTCGGSILGSTYTMTPVGPIPPASCDVSVEACDLTGSGLCSAPQVTTVIITEVDDPPMFSSTPPPTATEDILYTYNIVTTDPEGDLIALTVDVTDTCGGSIVDNGDGTGTYTFTPAGPIPPAGCDVSVNASGMIQTTPITIIPVDDLPVFSSTPPATATEDVLYTYNIVTTDPEGDLIVLSIDLTDTCGGSIVDNGDGTGTYTFTAAGPTPPAGCDVGVNAGGTVQTTSITIIPVDDPPVFSSTPPATATEDVLYTYNIVTTDPEGDLIVLSVDLTDTCGGSIVDNGDGTGTYTFTAVGPTPPAGCDVGVNASGTVQTTSITIIPVDDPPVFSSTPPPTATEDVLYTYNIVTTDPEGNPIVITVDASDTCGGSIVDNGDGTGTYTFTAVGPTPPAGCDVGVNAGGTVQTTSIAIIPVDDLPVFSSTPPATATEDVLYTYNIVTTDPEGDLILLGVDLTDTCGGTILDNGDGTGTYTFTAAGPTPPAGCDIGVNASGTVQTTSITIIPVDDPPVFSSTPPPTATEDVLYTYNIVTTDPEGDLIALTVDVTDTCGGSIVDNGDGTGTYTFTAAGPTPPAGCDVGVNAGGTVQTTSITIIPVDDPPVFSSTPPATATEDVLYTYNIVTTDPEGDLILLGVDLTDTCGGTILDNGDGTGTYTFTAAGPTPPAGCDVGVNASGTVQTTSITIIPVDDPPVFSSTPPPTATEDVLYTYNIVTTDPEGNPIVITVDASDTCGGSIVDNGDGTGTYTFTAAGPTPPAGCDVGVNAGGTVQTTSITIIPVDDLPVFSSTPPATATEDVLYTYNIVTTDPEGDLILLGVDLTDTCGGTILDNGDGTGTYTFTAAGPTPPAGCDVGVNASGTVQTTSITIIPVDDPPVFSSTPPATATEDVLYTYNIVTTDPEGNPIVITVDASDTCGGSIIDNGDGTGTYTFTAVGPTPPAGCDVGVNAGGTVQTTSITIIPVDDLPVFSSTPPATATEDVLYTYNIVTTDPEGDLILLSVDLTDTCGGTILDNGDGTGTYTFTAVGPTPPASCDVGVNAGGTVQTTTISITAVDDLPVFSSTPPPTATEDVLYTYNIVTTDPEGDLIALTVDVTDTCGGSIVDNGDGTGTYTFTAAGPIPPAGCDVGVNAGGTVQTTSITITAVDDLPVFSSTPPPTATEDVLYTYNIVTTDPEGNPIVITVDASDTCGGSIVDNGDGTGTYTFTPAGPIPPAGCNVGVNAGGTVQTTSITITAVDDPPVFSSTPPPSATEDVLYTYNIVTTDPDGDPIVITVDASDTCGGTIVDNGDGTATYTVIIAGPTPPAGCDVGVNAGGTIQTTSITITAVDDLPVFSSTPPPTATEDVLYTYNIVTTDPEGDLIVLNVDLTDTCGGSIVDNGDGTGTYTFTAAGPTPPAGCDVGINAGGSVQTTTISITAVDDLPVFSSTPPPTATEDVLYTYNIVTTDPEGDLIVITVDGSDTCGGSIVDNGDGTATYTATVAGPNPPANCNVGVNAGGTIQTTTITVTAVDDLPIFSSTPPPTATEDILYTYNIVTTDPEGDPIVLNVDLTDTCGGTIVDNGDGTGTYTFTPAGPIPPAGCVVGIDAGGTIQSTPITITAVDDPSEFTSTPPSTATEDILYTYNITANDPEGTPTSIALDVSDTCGGTVVDNGDGTAVYTATVAGPNPPATCVVGVIADGTVQSTTISVIAVNDAPYFTTSAPATATEGTQYSYAAGVADDELPPQTLTCSVSAGDTCLGSLAGCTYTFTPGELEGGTTCTVGISVSDTVDSTDQDTLININESNQNPYFTSAAPSSATEGTAFSYSPTYADDDLPNAGITDPGYVSCTGITANSCGAWLTFTGCNASGTPDESAGGTSCSYTANISDGLGAGAFQTVTLTTITEDNKAPSLTNLPATEITPLSGSDSFTATASDPDLPSDTLTFSEVSQTCSFGVTVASGGLISWTCGASTESCAVSVQVADDGTPAPALTDTDTLTINCQFVPTITMSSCSPNPVNETGVSTCAVTSNATAAIDSSDTCGGVLSGTGPWTYTFTPDESDGPGTCVAAVVNGTATDSETITINEVNRAPFWSTLPYDLMLLAYNTTYNNTNGVASDYDVPGAASGDPGRVTCSKVSDNCGFTVTVSGVGNGNVGCNIAFTAPATSSSCTLNMRATDGYGVYVEHSINIQVTKVIFVDQLNTAGPWNGQSWATAYQTIQAGLNAAVSGDSVWVAQSIYLENVTMATGVTLFGGFDKTEYCTSDRDWETNLTTINAGGTGTGVISAANARLDGFLVTNGRAGQGGGFYCTHSATAVENCIFRNNTATTDGGAVYQNQGGISYWNVRFEDNVAANGGAIFNDNQSSPDFSDCVFKNNRASTDGGAVYNKNNTGTNRFFNSMFAGNRAGRNGGALYSFNSPPTIYNSTFYGNEAGTSGGGIYDKGSAGTYRDLILWGNYAPSDPEINGATSITYSDVQGGWTGTGNINADPLFINVPLFWDLTTAAGTTTTVTVTDATIYAVNDVIELAQDGVARTVTAASGTTVTFTPALVSPSTINTWVENWGASATNLVLSLRLSNINAGQGSSSPCLNVGSNSSLYHLLDKETTRSDDYPDTGIVDLGYHYLP